MTAILVIPESRLVQEVLVQALTMETRIKVMSYIVVQ